VLPESGEDRAIAVPTAGGYLVAVADGADGTGNGGVAAQRLVKGLADLADTAASEDWFTVLLKLDEEILEQRHGGQTTGVVAFVGRGRVVGASVGDSSAWLVSPTGEITELTAHQRRRPLIGTGEALPVVFEEDLLGRHLLLATDGLTKYATPGKIADLVVHGSVEEIADCVRLPSGDLQDDVAVVIVAE